MMSNLLIKICNGSNLLYRSKTNEDHTKTFENTKKCCTKTKTIKNIVFRRRQNHIKKRKKNYICVKFTYLKK